MKNPEATALLEPEQDAEREKVEGREIRETSVKQEAVSALAEVAADEKEARTTVEQRLAAIPSESGVSEEKANTIFGSGGFSEKVNDILRQITEVAQQAKTAIGRFRRSHNDETQHQPVTETASDISVAIPAAPETIAHEAPPQPPAAETPVESSPEEAALREFLDQQIFPELNLTEKAQAKAITEAPEARREALERSFVNIRATIEEYFRLETVTGRWDMVASDRERMVRQVEVVYPIAQQLLTDLGLSDVTPEQLGIRKDVSDPDMWENVSGNFTRNVEEIIRERRMDERRTTENRIYTALKNEGRYGDLVIPPRESWEDESVMAEFRRAEEDAIDRETEATLSEREWGKSQYGEKVVATTDQIGRANYDVPRLPWENFTDRKTLEEAKNNLLEELRRTVETAFLNVNLTRSALEGFLRDGEFSALFSMDEKSKKTHAGELGDGADFYLRHRQTVERALGTYDTKHSTIYGTLGSDNDSDELRGGAPVYGDFVLRLKNEVMQRSSFTEGDSLTSTGHTEYARNKLQRQGIDGLDWAGRARAIHIQPEHAHLAKAIVNVERQRVRQLNGAPPSSFMYLEAHIADGLTPSDVDTITVSRHAIETKRTHGDLFATLSNNPEWKDRIHITE